MFKTNQWILWDIVTDEDGERLKIPVSPHTLSACNAHDPQQWVSYEAAALLGPSVGKGVAFVFTESDPYFFIDLDECIVNGQYSLLAQEMLATFPGAYTEISQSGTGLHIIGSAPKIAHRCHDKAIGIELYTEKRFIALTWKNMSGNPDTVHDLTAVVEKYLKPGAEAGPKDWTYTPVREWRGFTDDTELIRKALASTSAASTFGSKCSFRQLWEADTAALAAAYPDQRREYNASQADAALAQHLAFYTGCDCDRIKNLMLQSGLKRDKWESREDYLPRTILKAISQQRDVYGAVKLKADTESVRLKAEQIRKEKLAGADDAAFNALYNKSGPAASAQFWVNNATRQLDELLALLRPVTQAPPPTVSTEPSRRQGYQYMSADLQIEYFKGCCYVTSEHRIFTPDGQHMKPEQFNANYGGYIFQLDEMGEKTTRKAWEAFTENQCLQFPKVAGTCFKPDTPAGGIFIREGLPVVNTYIPYDPVRTHGDASRFIKHLEILLPDTRDRTILTSYLAACCQYKGVKFQWAPLIQGVEGNGKTLITSCLEYCLGAKYTHRPNASDLDNKFNGWLMDKLLIAIEDIFVTDNKMQVLEILKPMITGEGLEVQKKGVDQVTVNICCNFIFNSNHRGAVRKTENERRFAIFYTAQQEQRDIARDGMDGEYFNSIYEWLRHGGFAIVAEYLYTYAIPPEFNPATHCQRAPFTSSTRAAIEESLGGLEQEIKESIDAGKVGFCGGWISSVALDALISELRLTRAIPPSKRKEVLKSMGYIPHPALPDGRATGNIMCDGGKRPRLYVKQGTHGALIIEPAEVAKKYSEEQGQ